MTEPTKPTKPAKPANDPSSTPQQPAGDDGNGSSQTAQATAAATAAVSQVRERLVAGEQFMLAASLTIVVLSFFIFDFLLDNPVVGDFSVLLAILAVLAIWVHRWGHYDFGPGYRILIGALGVSLAILALLNLLAWARLGGNSQDFLHLLGRLTYWAAGVAAFVGAWQVFRAREE